MFDERMLWSESDFKQREALLASRGLRVPGGEDAVYGLFDDDGRLAATGSLKNGIIQAVAVRAESDGEGLVSVILTSLLRHASEHGIWHLFLFTKPDSASRFAALGFKIVAETDSSALLEWGKPGINEFVAELERASANEPGASCVVVNCNPFTLGHRFLIERAAGESRRLYVLVVKENLSEFPSEVRLRLVREGVSDIGNVTVMSGGDYVVSSATFPSYFTRDEDLACAHTKLDLEIFALKIAPALRVTRRFVGTEPFSPVTRIYNETMKRVLPPRGIEVTELDRLEIEGEIVSASKVRALLSEGNIEEAKKFVPPATRRFFETPELSSEPIRRIRESCESLTQRTK